MAREQDTPVTDSSGESWTTVRRSVPAEHIADVPDGVTLLFVQLVDDLRCMELCEILQ
jgi:hypothetical protein